jgi:hypothetical protein
VAKVPKRSSLLFSILSFKSAIKLVIPAGAESRNPEKPYDYWIPATGSSPAQALREGQDGGYQMLNLNARFLASKVSLSPFEWL